MNEELLGYISDRIGVSFTKSRSVSGGDISKAYILESSTGQLFAKVNEGEDALKMFRLEKKALEEIDATGAIRSPKVLLVDRFTRYAFIVMEYIDSRRTTVKDSALFGAQLARMHQRNYTRFGWDEDGFIGSLPQSNYWHDEWTSFHVKERLQVQINMALKNGLMQNHECPSTDTMMLVCDGFYNGISPVLIHGDLWSGNYLISTEGIPYLIDPAVYYGHGEVDIAMSRLFGGFDSDFYQAYHEIIPSTDGYQERMDIYQLYYLLVHLNLFGTSYHSSVMRHLKRYFL